MGHTEETFKFLDKYDDDMKKGGVKLAHTIGDGKKEKRNQTLEEFRRFLENKYRCLIQEHGGSRYQSTDAHHLYAHMDAMVDLINEFEESIKGGGNG